MKKNHDNIKFVAIGTLVLGMLGNSVIVTDTIGYLSDVIKYP